jgi:hypothetical protein
LGAFFIVSCKIHGNIIFSFALSFFPEHHDQPHRVNWQFKTLKKSTIWNINAGTYSSSVRGDLEFSSRRGILITTGFAETNKTHRDLAISGAIPIIFEAALHIKRPVSSNENINQL